jgi:hypothetical protein
MKLGIVGSGKVGSALGARPGRIYIETKVTLAKQRNTPPVPRGDYPCANSSKSPK